MTPSPPRPACPVCDAHDTVDCVRIAGVPVYCNVLFEQRSEALAAPLGDMDLVCCRGCGHLFNAAFDPARVEYSSAYENSLHHSPRFQAYALAQAQRLVAEHGLRNGNVVEIACGQGDFLHLLCELGGNRGIGFDPSYTPGRSDAVSATPGLRFVADYYSEAHAEVAADLICCRHALEHMARPVEFLRGLRRTVGDRPTVLFFEVPNSLYTLGDLGVWDLIYEHCGYFWAGSLATAFERAGFQGTRLATEFGGQYLTIDAVPGVAPGAGAGDSGGLTTDLQSVVQLASRFGDAYRARLEHWRAVLDRLRGQHRRAVLWGAGSKGVSFVNALLAGDVIDCLIDLNPHKHGRFVPGTGHEVRAPESLAARPPDAVIVMNPLYAGEIGAALRAMGIEAELLVEGTA